MKTWGFLWATIFLALTLARAESPYSQMAQREIFLSREYVQSASLFIESRYESPWPAEVLLAEDFRRFGWETLEQVLEYQPSFYFVQELNKRVVALRGVYFFETSNLLFLEKGFRLNGPGLENFQPFWNYPLSRIRRLEIVRGSGASLYGDASLSGVISLTPEETSGVSGGLLFGNREGRGGWLGLRTKVFDFFGFYFDREGEELNLSPSEDYALRPAPGEYVTDRTPDNYHLAFDFKKEGLRLLYRRMQFKESGPATLFGQNIGPEDAFAVAPHYKTLKDVLGLATHFYFKDWRFEGRGYYVRSQEESFFLTATPRELPDIFFRERILPANVESKLDFERYGFEGLAFKILPRHRILLGVKWEETYYRKAEATLYFPKSTPFFLPIPRDPLYQKAKSTREELYAFFGEWKWLFHPRWSLSLGGRYEHFEALGGKLSPRISLMWRTFEKGTLVFTYTRAYQGIPYVFRTLSYYHGGETSFPLQRSDQLNLCLRFRPGLRWNLSVTFFYQWLRNIVRPDPRNFLRYRPLGRWEEIGLEIELFYRSPKLTGFLNYSFYEITENQTPEGNWSLVYGNRIAGVPKWMLKGGLSLKLWEHPRIFVSPLFRYYGRTVKRDFLGSHWAPPYGVVDLNLLVEKESFRLGFKVENLFDHRFRRAGLLPPLPQPGRTFWIRLEKQF